MALSSETIAAIRAEREALASQVAALDAALLALDAVFGDAPAQPRKAVRTVIGRALPEFVPDGDDLKAVQRRDVLIRIIGKSPVGVTLGELRKQTPKMDGKDRSNSLQALKMQGMIKRVGNAWQVAA